MVAGLSEKSGIPRFYLRSQLGNPATHFIIMSSESILLSVGIIMAFPLTVVSFDLMIVTKCPRLASSSFRGGTYNFMTKKETDPV